MHFIFFLTFLLYLLTGPVGICYTKKGINKEATEVKKFLCIMLAVVFLFLCGCTATENKNAVLSPAMKEYLLSIDNFEVPVRQYGEERSHLLFGEKLVVGVFYPEVNISELDSEIERWVDETVSYYQNEVSNYKEKEDAVSSELTVSYESFLTSEKIVSVKMTGFFDSPYLAHPIEIIETFNGNIETQKILRLDDLLKAGGRESIIGMLSERVDLTEELIDEEILNRWLLTSEGLEIILPQGSYLPMSDGTKELLFTYEELRDIIIKSEIESPSEEDIPKQSGEEKYPEKDKADKIEIDKTKPMIALTFDDGPSAHTDRLLDIFNDCGGKGTFFVIGNIIDNRKDTVKRIVADGHEIAGHSWNHRQLTNFSESEIKDQIMSTRAKIYELTGYDAKLMRPPYGAFNDSVKTVAKEVEVSLVNWSVDTLDWKYRDANTVYKTIMEKAYDGAIVLCHDLHKTTVDAMEKVIPSLIEKGYQLVTVSELLEAKGKTVEAGKVYFNG